jgi:hypothetical protein
MPKYEVLGKNTDLGNGRLENGAIIKDDRDLIKMFPGKFRLLKAGAKRVRNEDDGDDEEVVDTTPRRDRSAIIDGGPTQPAPPNKSTDQRMSNSGSRGERVGPDGKKQELENAPGKKANPATGEGGPEGDEDAEEQVKPAAAKPTGGKRKKTEEAAEEAEYHEVTADFPEAKKADLAVFEYADGEYQVFDADDKDDAAAKPVNDGPLKTSKAVRAFLKKYHA